MFSSGMQKQAKGRERGSVLRDNDIMDLSITLVLLYILYRRADIKMNGVMVWIITVEQRGSEDSCNNLKVYGRGICRNYPIVKYRIFIKIGILF